MCRATLYRPTTTDTHVELLYEIHCLEAEWVGRSRETDESSYAATFRNVILLLDVWKTRCVPIDLVLDEKHWLYGIDYGFYTEHVPFATESFAQRFQELKDKDLLLAIAHAMAGSTMLEHTQILHSRIKAVTGNYLEDFPNGQFADVVAFKCLEGLCTM